MDMVRTKTPPTSYQVFTKKKTHPIFFIKIPPWGFLVRFPVFFNKNWGFFAKILIFSTRWGFFRSTMG